MRIHHYLFGYEDIEICSRHVACFLNLCRSAKWAYQPLSLGSGENACIRCTLVVAKQLRQACRSRGIEIRTVRKGGFPVLVYRYRLRAGLAVGMVLAALLIHAGCGVLWDIRVRGNRDISTETILGQLADCGLKIGMSLDEESLDSREIENRMLQASPDISWISVNIRGTVAEVQVRELQTGESAVDSDTVNLVASCDGIIESVHLLTGEVVVDVGQEVRAGELLISGVRDSDTQGFSVIGARGEVMARTNHTEIIQIPLESEEKVYTGEEKCEKSIFFFGKSIKFSKNTGIIGGSCDTIYTMENWTLPTGQSLPLGWEITRYLPYTIVTVQRTQREAYALAMAQLEQTLQQSAADALLLSKTVQVSYSQTHCTLVCEYSCLQNIAKPSPLAYSGAAKR
ncbi:MAG: sporulation protein YqfD [Clostridia bacterium]|nr:sporulation protein YqfD [Clostridia bacterium]